MSTQPSPMERLRRSGVSPDRALGQNFLVDPNIVDVIERTAGLGPGDIVLEVGPGLGVLTERLLERCKLVHCIEFDRRLAGMLAEEFSERNNLHLIRDDALRVDLGSLEPGPGKFVSNLPYNIAAPLVMKSLEELPGTGLWCLMLQKEVADRLFAAPGSSDYGAISVMVQLQAEKLSSRPVSGNVFYPRPNVRSSLLAFSRRGDAITDSEDFTATREIVQACFSHRRKTLVNSISEVERERFPSTLAGLDAAGRKALAAEALGRMGLREDARPQSLSPPEYRRLAQLMAADPGGRHA